MATSMVDLLNGVAEQARVYYPVTDETQERARFRAVADLIDEAHNKGWIVANIVWSRAPTRPRTMNMAHVLRLTESGRRQLDALRA